MPHLAPYELDDCESALEEWLDDGGHAHERRGSLIKAIDRIYEICQTAHARELKRTPTGDHNDLANP
jgi:hypothetical protein